MSIDLHPDSIWFDGHTAQLHGVLPEDVVGEIGTEELLDAMDFDVIAEYVIRRQQEDADE